VDLPFGWDEEEAREELARGEVTNRVLTVLVSAAYGKNMSSRTFSKTIIIKFNVGKKMIRKRDGKAERYVKINRKMTYIPF